MGRTGNVGWTFGYNPASQIVSETRDNDAFAWTGAVAVDRNYAVNGLNQYTAAGPASFAYDANGNLTADGTNIYVYDIENRLVKATTGSVVTNLVYDPLGRLFQVDKGTNASTTTFLYDGDALAAEYNYNGGTLKARFVHGSNAAADDPLVWYTSSTLSSKRWLHSDRLGSIVAATNATGGSPTINSYDEYGIPGPANTGRFQYTGQAWIGELGMYHYKARIYSPRLGRFLQTDPVGYQGGINLYAYVDNDPINLTDPTGNAPCPDQPNCWRADGERKQGEDVRANSSALDYATKNSKEVEVYSDEEAVNKSENISSIEKDSSGNYQRVPLNGEAKIDAGKVETQAQSRPGTEMLSHGQPGTIVPGPKDDSAVVQNKLPSGIAHSGRYGVLEFVAGRFQFTLTKGSLTVEPGLQGINERKDMQVRLNEFQERRP